MIIIPINLLLLATVKFVHVRTVIIVIVSDLYESVYPRAYYHGQWGSLSQSLWHTRARQWPALRGPHMPQEEPLWLPLHSLRWGFIKRFLSPKQGWDPYDHKEGSPFDPTPTPVLTLNESHHREIDWNVICKFVYILSISLSSSHLLVWVSQ